MHRIDRFEWVFKRMQCIFSDSSIFYVHRKGFIFDQKMKSGKTNHFHERNCMLNTLYYAVKRWNQSTLYVKKKHLTFHK